MLSLEDHLARGFSMAGARIRHGFIDDPRNYLFKHYFNVVKAVQPKAFVMENVKGMKTCREARSSKRYFASSLIQVKRMVAHTISIIR